MKKYLIKPIYLLYTCSFLFSALSACKKFNTELPGGTQATALNFYAATDVMLIAYGQGSGAATAVWVDTLQKHTGSIDVNPQSKIIALGFSTSGRDGEFPILDGAGGFISFLNYNYNEKGHRLFFTDTANVVQLDTIIRPAAKSYTCIYLADAPVTVQNQQASYKILAVNEERADIPAGKVGVRFVHLSPDAGSLTCSLLKADGSIAQLLSNPLGYGQASDYIYFDNTVAVSGLIKFSLDNNANNVKILTGVTFTPGHSYIVLVTGFLNDQQRQVRSGTNSGGGAQYATVTIPRNLRSVIRKSY